MPAVRRSRDAALAFVERAVDDTTERLPTVDRDAMRLVLLLHRVTNAIVYDLESTVHRPSGWSWSAFRAVFTLWVNGPMEPSRLAEQSGMSRQAVSALLKTLAAEGLVERRADDRDRCRSARTHLSRSQPSRGRVGRIARTRGAPAADRPPGEARRHGRRAVGQSPLLIRCRDRPRRRRVPLATMRTRRGSTTPRIRSRAG